jgi:hypothetical protein
LLIGALAAVVCDLLIGGSERVILAAVESGVVPPGAGIWIEVVLLVVLTTVALAAVGERSVQGMVGSVLATVAGYLIGATHLAALSIGTSVAVLGERAHRAPLAAPTGTARARRRRRR